MMRILLLICLIFSSCGKTKKDGTIINVSDYGILSDTKENITGKINGLLQELETDGKTLVFPKGRYDFYPDSTYLRDYYESNTYDVNPKRLGVLLDKTKNLTIDAQGSDFIYHGHIQPFTLDNAENITIKNVNIDWENPLTAEAEVLEADSTHILLKIDKKQFPFKVHEKGLTFYSDDWKADWKVSGGSWLIEINKDHIIPPKTGDMGTINGDLENVTYTEVGDGKLLLKGRFTKTPTVGNYLILRHSTRDHAGMFLFHSKNIKLENINVYHTSGLGILSQYCENIEMHNVNMVPNPKKNRYLSGHDDGLHFMGCKGKIVIDSCDAQGLMDDPINIHGTYAPIIERLNDTTIVCNYAHDMSKGLIWGQPNDTVAFVKKESMNTKGTATVKEFIELNKKQFKIVFKEAIPEFVSDNYSLENLTWTPDVTITNCRVGSNRARGYLISTPGKVLIENNYFETSGSAILIAGDANYWYESGAVKDITIRNNTFSAYCNSSPYQFCKAVISIYPEIPSANPTAPYHRNITIEQNEFSMSDYPILYAKSVNNLNFSNNTILRSHIFEPWHPVKHSFYLDACRNVFIKNNNIGDDVLGKDIKLVNMPKTELNAQNNLSVR
ncbi:right-handed parallel beta-helix repeat-containing protein [Aureibaculum sp. 2210JD6-5]|uniref:alpha-1,3-galactosidase-related protein n=1 Tax=Aureibaculum sp. 2210JD6-5 TaxID=3103957 RepID=UPI002AAC902C|nr:right-handed parallel beta-helix repeat-containing protein [Aureibaculum sp. 2210JD6-5]MDY7393996.1 right-handed parallel beta-helix repeat-containing protein [Aureibaculum sp. 2210JD6-5]